MKKYILLAISALLASTGVMAQNAGLLKYVPNSFRSTSAADVQAGEKGGLGQMNMTSKVIDIAGSHDDADIKSGVIRIGFQNISNNDIEGKVKAAVNPGYVNKTEFRQNPVTGAMECWVHVDPGKGLTLTVTVEGIGSARATDLDVKSGEMYTMTFNSDEKLPITINCNVGGTQIYLDGQHRGVVVTGMPFKIEDVTMSKHVLRAVTPDNNEVTQDIEVSKNNIVFNLDLKKKYSVLFRSNEPGVGLYENEQLLATLPATLEVSEGPHAYIIKKFGFPDRPYSLNITGSGEQELIMQMYKAIDFQAMANQTDLYGASIFINDVLQEKTTPAQIELPYGKYRIRMSSYGRDKRATITVDENSSSVVRLKLPAHHRSFNPFEIDYRKRISGISFAYVQKWLNVSDGKGSKGMDYGGQERHMHGLQVGVPIQPYFKYGLGLITGIYYEAYFLDYPDDNVKEMVEHNMYIPLDLQFRLPISTEFSIYACGGVAMDWSMATKYKAGDISYDVDYKEDYWVNPLNFSAEVGAGIQYKALQASFKYQWGLNNNSTYIQGFQYPDGLNAKLRKLQAQISLLF